MNQVNEDRPIVTTTHFNRLTEAELERLAILAEEAAEIVHISMKIMRHGYESTNPTKDSGETNRQMLQREIGDIAHTLCRMEEAHDIDDVMIRHHSAERAHKPLYLHHQG